MAIRRYQTLQPKVSDYNTLAILDNNHYCHCCYSGREGALTSATVEFASSVGSR